MESICKVVLEQLISNDSIIDIIKLSDHEHTDHLKRQLKQLTLSEFFELVNIENRFSFLRFEINNDNLINALSYLPNTQQCHCTNETLNPSELVTKVTLEHLIDQANRFELDESQLSGASPIIATKLTKLSVEQLIKLGDSNTEFNYLNIYIHVSSLSLALRRLVQYSKEQRLIDKYYEAQATSQLMMNMFGISYAQSANRRKVLDKPPLKGKARRLSIEIETNIFNQYNTHTQRSHNNIQKTLLEIAYLFNVSVSTVESILRRYKNDALPNTIKESPKNILIAP